MQPERLAVALRPRSGWEAIDLGLQLARQGGRMVFLGPLMLTVPVTLLAFVLGALFDHALLRDWGWVLIWWLKPLYDRVILFVLSRAVFGEATDWRTLRRALGGLAWRTGLLPALLWARLDPLRTVRLPVSQLEGLPGRAGRARRKLLPARVSGAGYALLLCCANFEFILSLSVLALLAWMMPPGLDPFETLGSLLSGNSDEDGFSLLGHALVLGAYLFGLSVIEPFFVAAGFGLYLKRRTDLEAWDVELQFRRLAPGGTATLAAAAMALALFGLQAPPARAADSSPAREVAAARAPAVIKDVLKHPDFGHEKTERRLQWRTEPKPKAQRNTEWADWMEGLFELWKAFGLFVASAWRVLAWAVLGLLVIVALWKLLPMWREFEVRRGGRRPVAEIGGMDIRPESLPADVPATARALLAAGRSREALALLYRAALSRLAHGEGIPFERGDTEGDCLARVTRARSPTRPYFARLARHWQHAAYAHRDPAPGEGEALCGGWQDAFGAQR